MIWDFLFSSQVQGNMAYNQETHMQILTANNGIFTQILNKVLNFLVAKLGYQQPKSCSLNKFQVGCGLPGYCSLILHFRIQEYVDS